MSSPGMPIAQGLYNTFRYAPQHAIDTVLGQKWGPRVEGWLGMSPAPDTHPVEAPTQQADPAVVERANESFRNLSTMKKPLPKGK